jgi:hypothetical protein
MNLDYIGGFKKLYEDHGYRWYDSELPFNVNIFSIRSKESKAGKFDDRLFVVYRDKDLKWDIKVYPVTTDPGKYYLENPLNVKGTAILVPGQYKGVYKLDKHQGKYTALCQRNGTVKVYRDSNKDEVLDHNPDSIQEGYFGINIHKAKKETENVGKWSAGCTVFKNSSDFDEFIRICQQGAKKFGNKFTYTLFEG